VWENAEGFRAWTHAYEEGDAVAVGLARSIRLPKKADQTLMADIRTSLDAGGAPSFLCALDTDGHRIAWVMESADAVSDRCTNTFYVSTEGQGTTSEITTQPAANCSQLCKPKRLEETLFIWQCDVREGANDTASWTQLQMNRMTGASEVVPCQQDKLGTPTGCLR
jgi:hypothetical protein